LLSVHTWSDPRRVGPYNSEAWIWKNGALLQVHELPKAGRLKGRRFAVADVAPVVELVRKSWEPETTTTPGD
jgi:hypothetical protein